MYKHPYTWCPKSGIIKWVIINSNTLVYFNTCFSIYKEIKKDIQYHFVRSFHLFETSISSRSCQRGNACLAVLYKEVHESPEKKASKTWSPHGVLSGYIPLHFKGDLYNYITNIDSSHPRKLRHRHAIPNSTEIKREKISWVRENIKLAKRQWKRSITINPWSNSISWPANPHIS